MLSRSAPTDPGNTRLAHWYEMGEVQTCVLSLFTTGASWVGGLMDWRGFLAVNLPLIGKAVWAVMRKATYRPDTTTLGV